MQFIISPSDQIDDYPLYARQEAEDMVLNKRKDSFLKEWVRTSKN